ncbi:murein hydrolase activator EnvC family protein, partial [Marilutibacter aestuarii]
MRARPVLAAALLAGAWLGLSAPLPAAQDRGETERKLDAIKDELRSVAAERRRLEGQRGTAHRELREADEKVGQSNRRLREIEAELAAQREALDELEARRATMQAAMSGQREELAQLVRAAYAQGGDAPLKVLLAQDSVAEANRLLTYHRYMQQDRMKRIRELASRLEALDAVERDIAARRQVLEDSRGRLDAQLATLREDRNAREAVVANLDKRYKSRRDREQALGRDAKGLEQLLARLRAAAAKAEAERRRIAAERAAAAA